MTRAALWRSAPDEQSRQDELAWFSRVERDQGRPVSVEALRERLDRVYGSCGELRVTVIPFVALPSTGSRKEAEAEARRLHCGFIAFGEWFRQLAIRLGCERDVKRINANSRLERRERATKPVDDRLPRMSKFLIFRDRERRSRVLQFRSVEHLR